MNHHEINHIIFVISFSRQNNYRATTITLFRTNVFDFLSTIKLRENGANKNKPIKQTTNIEFAINEPIQKSYTR